MLKLHDVRREINLEKLFAQWPLLARVANRVGPWFRLAPLNINGRIKSIALFKSTNGGSTGHSSPRAGRSAAPATRWWSTLSRHRT